MSEPESSEKNIYVEFKDGLLSVVQIRGLHTKEEVDRFWTLFRKVWQLTRDGPS
jgi:hypothetical protein